MSTNGKRKAKRIAVLPGPSIKKRGFGHEMPPEAAAVHIYFDEQGFGAEAEKFFEQHERESWRSKHGTPLRNWKVLAADWIFNCKQALKLEARITVNRSFV